MASDLTALRSKRPEQPAREVAYTLTPEYYQHKPHDDRLAILVCQIKIWEPKDDTWFPAPAADNCLTIRECESVEVTDSAKDLINKAVVRFPRGTIISRSSKKSEKVTTGDKASDTATKEDLVKATNDGEFVTTPSSTYSDTGDSITSMAINYDSKGLIDYNRAVKNPALLSPNDVAIGNRIEIRLGYAYSEIEFEEMNTTDNHKGMDIVFTGFITSVSPTTPLELECQNMAYVFSCISAPNVPVNKSLMIKDFLDDDSEFHLLKDTGIPLAESSKGSTISISGYTITDNLTVADILSAWNERGILCIIDTKSDGTVQLRVGLTYNSGNGEGLPNDNKKYITYNGGNKSVKLIQFDWDVAQDKLTFKRSDKKFIAIEAHGTYMDVEKSINTRKLFKVTIRKNPDIDDEGWTEDDFQVINTQELTERKFTKHKEGTSSSKLKKGRIKDKVKLDKYNIIPYFSTTENVTKEQLIEEAKQFWAKQVPNGISGSIVIFGDVFVKPTEIIGLIDMRYPEKNGYYYVESVSTSFGLDGYRREITIPFKVASFSESVKII